MKNILLKFIFIIFLLTSSVQAKTFKVVSLQNFSTQAPCEFYKIQLLETVTLKNELVLEDGTIIIGRVDRIQEPQRGKRDSYFEITPLFYMHNGTSQKIIDPNFVVRIMGYKPINPGKVVLTTSWKVMGFIFKGVTQSVSFTQGVAQAPQGQRIKNGFEKVYKDSFLSYIEVGKELEIKTGDILLLKTKKIE